MLDLLENYGNIVFRKRGAMAKIKCLKCNDIIEGDKKGTFITCKCKSCYIDETKYYCRVGGDLKKIEIIKEIKEK